MNIVLLFIGFMVGFLFGYVIFLQRFRKIKKDAKEDFLTKVYNYREFDNVLTQYLDQLKKHSQYFSVALIDLDEFKQVNDQYGYDTGDKVIKECAELITQNVRKEDSVFRYKTGDEFVVIFPGVGIQEAKSAAGRIRERIKNHSFNVPGNIAGLTSSIGIIYANNRGVGYKQLTNKLEAALKKAKGEEDSIQTESYS